MDYLGKQINGRDIATVELLEQIYGYFDESGAALNALALGGVNATSYALKADVDKNIADLVGTAPDTLDTIEELAAALKENADVVATLDDAITNKANQSDLDDALERILVLEENPSVSAESIIEALGYTPADDSDLDNFFTKQEINEALDGYLTTDGGWVDYIETNKVTSVGIEVETLTADAININGDFAILGGNSLYISQENYINGDQGGLYITSEADLIDLTSRKYIDFFVGTKKIAYFNSGGLILENKSSIYIGDYSRLYVSQDNYFGGSASGVSIVAGGRDSGIYLSAEDSISFSVGQEEDTVLITSDGLSAAYIWSDSLEGQYLEVGSGKITGNLVIEGNLEVHGTSSSGGSAEVGDTALADLEARVAALESLIS